jgi:hypothetical protein
LHHQRSRDDEQTTPAAKAVTLNELTNDELDENNDSNALKLDHDRNDFSSVPISAAVIRQSLADTYYSF